MAISRWIKGFLLGLTYIQFRGYEWMLDSCNEWPLMGGEGNDLMLKVWRENNKIFILDK